MSARLDRHPPVMPGAWKEKAACLGSGVKFFPTDEQSAIPAKAVCAQCPVKDACLDHAMKHREGEGVWGGMTERERRSYARRMRKQLVKS